MKKGVFLLLFGVIFSFYSCSTSTDKKISQLKSSIDSIETVIANEKTTMESGTQQNYSIANSFNLNKY